MSPEEALVHFGVKGMHWGQRKNSKYSATQRQADKEEFGRGGVRRINKRLNKGLKIQEARDKEDSFQLKRSLAIVGVLAVTRFLVDPNVGGSAVSAIKYRAETKRGQAAAANSMGLPAPTKPNYVKPNRGGVHKITTM